MNTTLLVLLFVGIILITANAGIRKTTPVSPATAETQHVGPEASVFVGKDLAAYMTTSDDASNLAPSDVYRSMFVNEDVVR